MVMGALILCSHDYICGCFSFILHGYCMATAMLLSYITDVPDASFYKLNILIRVLLFLALERTPF